MKKSNLPPRNALQKFLMVYRRTPLANGSSLSELLNGRQIRAHIDLLLQSPVHLQQSKQSMDNSKWITAIVTEVCGPRSVIVKIEPDGLVWHRHIEQLRHCYDSKKIEESIIVPLALLSCEPTGPDKKQIKAR